MTKTRARRSPVPPTETSVPLRCNRDFVLFVTGQATVTLGNAMATVALSFAVLAATSSLTATGLVLAARIVPLVVLLPIGGVLGDRLPRRLLMAGANTLRMLSQALLAVGLLADVVGLPALLALSVLGGVGEALFTPAYNSLTPSLVPPDKLGDANAVLNTLRSGANVAGPALASVLVAFISPAAVLLVDAASFLPSILTLLLLRVPDRVVRTERTSILTDLRHGWGAFTAHTWVWVITVQFTLFNLLLWGPYLVLGPATAAREYGGAGPWGIVLALYGAGAVIGGLSLVGRTPRRPLLVATLATLTWTAPSAALALVAPIWVVAAAAAVAGASSAVFNTLFFTTLQRRIPPESLSRVMSYVTFGAYSVGPLGLALAGPIAEATSIPTVLAVGVIWQLLASTVVIALPSVRSLRTEARSDRHAAATSGRTSTR